MYIIGNKTLTSTSPYQHLTSETRRHRARVKPIHGFRRDDPAGVAPVRSSVGMIRARVHDPAGASDGMIPADMP